MLDTNKTSVYHVHVNQKNQTIFFFNDTATTEIYTLSLHDALPICPQRRRDRGLQRPRAALAQPRQRQRSEEHTSELQSHSDLVCRLLLEKKNRNTSGGRLLVLVILAAAT